LQVPAHVAGFPAELYSDRTRQIALCDFLTRSFGAAVSSAGAGDLATKQIQYMISMLAGMCQRHLQRKLESGGRFNAMCGHKANRQGPGDRMHDTSIVCVSHLAKTELVMGCSACDYRELRFRPTSAILHISIHSLTASWFNISLTPAHNKHGHLQRLMVLPALVEVLVPWRCALA